MNDHDRFTAAEARALLEAAKPGPWEWSVWVGRHPARLCTEDQFQSGEGWLLQLDSERVHSGTARLLAAAPDLAASVVALHGEVERLRAILPPEQERGQGIVGEGSWAVFAERVVAERDAAQEQARQATAAERARIVAWLKERADKAYAVGNEPYGDALLNASRILETSEATP